MSSREIRDVGSLACMIRDVGSLAFWACVAGVVLTLALSLAL